MAEELNTLSKDQVQRIAAAGKLSWKGKKITCDPFVPAELVYVIEEGYTVSAKLRLCGREDEIGADDVLFSSGVLQGQIFRFWKVDYEEKWIESPKAQSLTLMELKSLVDACEDEASQLVWKCPIPRWKPEPLPILQLTDRTGAFANLWMDYGLWGKDVMHSEVSEEVFWEKDLLETDFIKKTVGVSHYYCPMDKVVKSLTFLLDLGWTLLDHLGKKIVRQGIAEWSVEGRSDHLLMKGRIAYGSHIADAKDVLGAFNRR